MADAPSTLTTDFIAPLTIEQIEQILPHRYPFLLVDRVIELEPMSRVVALKNVSATEPHFQGHFPQLKVMPGVLIIEALAQAAAIMHLCERDNMGGIVYLMGVDNAKFRKPVVPGDTLRLETTGVKVKRRFGMVSGKAYVGEDLVAEAEIKYAADKPEAKS